MEELIASFRNSNFSDAMIQELLCAKIKADAEITAREREAKIKAEADIAKTKIKEEAGIRKSRIKANHVHFPLFPTFFLVYFFNRLALFIFLRQTISAFLSSVVCWDLSPFLSTSSTFPQTRPQIQHSPPYSRQSQSSSYRVSMSSSEILSSQQSTEMVTVTQKEKMR